MALTVPLACHSARSSGWMRMAPPAGLGESDLSRCDGAADRVLRNIGQLGGLGDSQGVFGTEGARASTLPSNLSSWRATSDQKFWMLGIGGNPGSSDRASSDSFWSSDQLAELYGHQLATLNGTVHMER